MALATVELIWLKALLLKLHNSLSDHLLIIIDSLSVQALSHIPIFYVHTKHIEINHHFIHNQVI